MNQDFIESAKQLEPEQLKYVISILNDVYNQRDVIFNQSNREYPVLPVPPEALIPLVEEWIISFICELFNNMENDYSVREMDDNTLNIKLIVNGPFNVAEDNEGYPKVVVNIDGIDSNAVGLGNLNTSPNESFGSINSIDTRHKRAWLYMPVRVTISAKSRAEANILAGIIFANIFRAAPMIQKAFDLHEVYPPKLTSARKTSENHEVFKSVVTFNLFHSMTWTQNPKEKQIYYNIILRIIGKLKNDTTGSIINIIGIFGSKITNELKRIIEQMRGQ